VVYQDLMKDTVHQLDLTGLPAGLYFVRLGEKGSLGIKKLIVN
jgi:hypothetical protein